MARTEAQRHREELVKEFLSAAPRLCVRFIHDAHDFAGLKVLAEAAGERLHRGILLYTGSEAILFGRNMIALPTESLWELAATTVC